jgi:hypothetical protein
VILGEGDHESEGPAELGLADGKEEGATAVTGRGEVGVSDLFAFRADQLRERKRREKKRSASSSRQAGERQGAGRERGLTS